MEIIAQHSTIFYVLAFGFGLYMCWGIGANDVANAMGTSVGSGATHRQAGIDPGRDHGVRRRLSRRRSGDGDDLEGHHRRQGSSSRRRICCCSA
jgi:hypothetical protein